MNDRKAFAQLMAGLAATYEKDVTPAMVEIYWNALADLSDDQVRSAINCHVRDTERAGSFFPRPADIRRHVEGTQQMRSELALAKVATALRTVSRWDSVQFDDLAIHAALDQMGGWDACYFRFTYGERKDFDLTFLRLYRAAEAQPDLLAQVAPPVLPGLMAQVHQQKGLPAPEPRQIGNARLLELPTRQLAGGDS